MPVVVGKILALSELYSPPLRKEESRAYSGG